MAQGFIVNDATGSINTSSFVGVKLHEDTGVDANSKTLPSGCYISHLELKFTGAGSATDVDCYITWDSTGDDPLTAKVETVELTAGATGGVQHTVITVAEYARAPATQTTAGAVYIWLKLTGASGTLSLARLHWHDNA
jgi:hypothetical protein